MKTYGLKVLTTVSVAPKKQENTGKSKSLSSKRGRELLLDVTASAMGFEEIRFFFKKMDPSRCSPSNKVETFLLEIVLLLHKGEDDTHTNP